MIVRYFKIILGDIWCNIGFYILLTIQSLIAFYIIGNLCRTTQYTADKVNALDSKTSEEIMSVFEKLNESGKTIIIVTHDKDIAAKCRRVIEIADGRIVSDSKN